MGTEQIIRVGNISISKETMAKMKKSEFVERFKGRSAIDLNQAYKDLKAKARK